MMIIIRRERCADANETVCVRERGNFTGMLFCIVTNNFYSCDALNVFLIDFNYIFIVNAFELIVYSV